MRNLTLGLTIVAGGILAALPFRRTEPVDIRPEESAPADPVSTTSPSYPSPVGMLVDQSESQEALLARLTPEPKPTAEQLPVQRELSAPLTYEQLAVPISRPEEIEQRFSATEKFQRPGNKNKKIATAPNDVVPESRQAKHSLVGSNPQREPKSVLVSEPSQNTSLASTPLRETQIDRLPKKRTSTRQRHWIRQP